MMSWAKRVGRFSSGLFWVEVEPLATHCYTDLETEIDSGLGITIDIGSETKTEDGWLRYVAERDWPTFWQSLTPAEVRDALRAAPRVAGEWAQHGYGDTWTRSDVASQTCAKAFPTWYAPGNHRFAMMIGDKILDEGFASIADAKSAADAALVAAGWVLL